VLLLSRQRTAAAAAADGGCLQVVLMSCEGAVWQQHWRLRALLVAVLLLSL
jgi:hypothetical protein